MFFRAHKLRENKKTVFPHNWIFFDTEGKIVETTDDKEVQEFRFAVAQYWRLDKKRNPQREKVCFTPRELFDFILSCTRPKIRLFVAFHNANYDIPVSGLIQEFLREGWSIQKFLMEDNVRMISFRKDQRTVVLYDTFNVFKTSVEKLGEALGLPKLKVDFARVNEDEFIEYCRRDVEIIASAMMKLRDFLVDNDLGSFGLSAAQIAFKIFRHRFMRHNIYIHELPEATKLERDAYFGGRCECFKLGYVEGPVYTLDVNSMYPYVMRSFDFPVRLTHYANREIPLWTIERFLKDHCVIARVLIRTDKAVFPKKSEKGKLIFPVGTFWTCLCTSSLKYALEHDLVLKVSEAAVYEKAPVFVDYVDFMYRQRLRWKQEGNKPFEMMGKIMLNSLYGKFGQRKIEQWIEDLNEDEDLPTFFVEVDGNVRIRNYRVGNKLIKVEPTEDKAFNAFVAIAAHVTDYARMRLWELMNKAGMENVYYCDTDSLFVNEEGFKNLSDEIDGNSLGKLKLEMVHEWVIFRGCKDYLTPSQEKIKGVPKSGVRIKDDVFEYWQFRGFKTWIREGCPPNTYRKRVIKVLKREYDKGLVDDKGNITPIFINEVI